MNKYQIMCIIFTLFGFVLHIQTNFCPTGIDSQAGRVIADCGGLFPDLNSLRKVRTPQGRMPGNTRGGENAMR